LNNRIVIDTIADPSAGRVIHLSAAKQARKAVMSHLFQAAVRAADEAARKVEIDRAARAARSQFFLVKNS